MPRNGKEPPSTKLPFRFWEIERFKSIRDRTRMELGHLTVLAGANSSGKSSAIQPLLLLKQTLESSQDVGPLRLDGPNVKFTSFEDQLLWKGPSSRGGKEKSFSICFEAENPRLVVEHTYERNNGAISIAEMTFGDNMKAGTVTVRESMSERDIGDWPRLKVPEGVEVKREVVRDRCFLGFELHAEPKDKESADNFRFQATPAQRFRNALMAMIHLPGLRGNPERLYPIAQVGGSKLFPGLFPPYVAGILHAWKDRGDDRLTKKLPAILKDLGLTWKIDIKKLSDTEGELLVGRLPQAVRGGGKDMVSIADVGLGVSQALPIAVALLAAEPGQLVFIEQPEIHLHPRAQVALAGPLLDAAARGVVVVVETHSRFLLLGIQEKIAAKSGYLSDLVKLHWFQRDPQTGATNVTTGELDKNGAFGDWPEDFAETAMDIERRFIEAPFEEDE